MLRYVGSDDIKAMNDLMVSVGGSPPWGGVSYDEASAVYELLEDYSGPGAAADASYAAVLAFLDGGSDSALTVEVFRCVDAIQSDPEDYGRDPVDRGLKLARRLGHPGAEASFLSFEAGLHIRQGDDESARKLTRKALDMFLELADADEAYTKRVQQSAANAVSLTARTGDLVEARRLFDDLADVMDSDVAEKLRRALGSAS
jgi:hypothetical protein